MNKKQLTAVLVLAAAIFLARDKVPGKPCDYGCVLVSGVIDGDTLKLENGERVRLIGIDTPETRPNPKLYSDARRTGQDVNTIIKMGKRASEFTKNMADGKKVSLEFDVQKRDKYGRLLAYVYVSGPRGSNGEPLFLNAAIVEAGYANLMTIPPNVKYAGLFQKLYQEARRKNRGLWKDKV